ncbi:hypothetical protein D1220_13780 [Klebsiella pneumoniae]|nr:hypothetical protein D1220_13780 [Klebsiella pneumoniae]
MPGGAALTGPAYVGRIRRSRHPAACDTHLNPYALPAIIHANKRFIRCAVKPRPSGRGYKARFSD